jgi:penicillin-binding protein 1A
VKRVVLMTIGLAVCGIVLGGLAGVGWVVAVADNGPNLSQLTPRSPHPLSEIFAADGSPLGYIHSDTVFSGIAGSRIPITLKEATVAIEDRRFYQHGALDYQGILRAGIKDLFGGGTSLQGASTLTMQLVDNKYMPSNLQANHNLKYKIIQAKLAQQLEKRHTKSWILSNYLNDVPYGTVNGETAIGVGAASQIFFNRPVSKLNLAQDALLAGLPQAPSEYNPFLHPNLARNRRRAVLQSMVKSGYISQAQADSADASPLQVRANTTFSAVREPYVFDYVRQQLINRFGVNTVTNGGLKVYTTIDLKRQQEARLAIANNEGQPGDPAAAVVSVDPNTGHILAMATSSTYGTTTNQTNFDYATQAHRQTGSAFKVFVLMTLIHDYQGDPNQTYYTSRELLPGWLPGYPTYHVQTAEHSYLGSVSITKATTLSDNTVFAQLDADVGPTKVRDTAYAMGITSHLDGFPAEGIGGLRIGVSPLEMSDAYATVANGGVHITPTIVSKVVFPDGSVVNLGDPPHTRVFTQGEAYAATQVLKTVIQSGTGVAAGFGCPAAGKTGTTSNYTDAWFVGYTPQMSTAVWVGYPKSTISMNDVNGLGPGFGGTLAAPIWRDYMTQASNGYCTDFPLPSTFFAGTPFFGHYAVTGQPIIVPGKKKSTTSPFNNPSLFAQPKSKTGGIGLPTGQGGGTGGTGNGGGGPPGKKK